MQVLLIISCPKQNYIIALNWYVSSGGWSYDTAPEYDRAQGTMFVHEWTATCDMLSYHLWRSRKLFEYKSMLDISSSLSFSSSKTQ